MAGLQIFLSKSCRISRALASICAATSHSSIVEQHALTGGSTWLQPTTESQVRRLCSSNRAEGSAEMEYEPPMQLHEAAVSGDLGGLHRSLMDTWSHIDSRDEKGWTVLSRAAFALQPEVVEYLLWNGADARIPSKDGEDIIYQLAKVPPSKERFKGRIHKAMTPAQCKNRITEAIISNFPEFQPETPDGQIFPKLSHKVVCDMETILKQKSMLENGKYWTMDARGLGGCFMQLDFMVDFFFKMHKSITKKQLVDALIEAGVPAVSTTKEALEGEVSKSDDAFDKMIWKVVQWGVGEWKLMGVSGPMFRGDVEIENSGTVCDVLRRFGALDRLWEVNVGFKKAEELFSLQHLQNICVRFSICEGGFRSLAPCRPRGFHQDFSTPVAEAFKQAHGSPEAAYDAIYRTDSTERINRWLGTNSLLAIQDLPSHGTISFLSAGGAATPLDVSNWIRALHWFVCTADLAIPLGKKNGVLERDDALDAVLKRFMGDPLLRRWGRERRKREIDLENIRRMH